MGNQTEVTEIIQFLERVKRLITRGRYDFVPRRKSMQALALHGLTITDAKAEILGLVIEDYYKGPKQDFDPARPGDIWEFKKNIEGIGVSVHDENCSLVDRVYNGVKLL